MLAVMNNENPEVVSTLMKAGSNRKLKSEEGRTAFDYAGENEKLVGTDVYGKLSEARY